VKNNKTIERPAAGLSSFLFEEQNGIGTILQEGPKGR